MSTYHHNQDHIPSSSRAYAIEVDGIGRTYRRRRAGSRHTFGQRLRGLWNYDYDEVHAVKDLSFGVLPGERVAFVGPNGAGKSTTIKMLAGILCPTRGTCRVEGVDPVHERARLARIIGTVFGQRSQLWLHLPVMDSLYLLGAIYDMPRREVRARLEGLAKVFDIEGLLSRTAKQLSLGERMRCELLASLLHRPRVLFLDEPTIGLDVVGKGEMRALVKLLGAAEGCTVLLTSHDTGDMEQVCDRVIVINAGSLVVDAPVHSIRDQFLSEKHITIRSLEALPDVHIPEVITQRIGSNELRLTLDTRKTGVRPVMEQLISSVPLADLRVEDASMEEVIRAIYGRGSAS